MHEVFLERSSMKSVLRDQQQLYGFSERNITLQRQSRVGSPFTRTMPECTDSIRSTNFMLENISFHNFS